MGDHCQREWEEDPHLDEFEDYFRHELEEDFRHELEGHCLHELEAQLLRDLQADHYPPGVGLKEVHAEALDHCSKMKSSLKTQEN